MEILTNTEILKSILGLTVTIGLFGIVGYSIVQIVKRIPTNILEKVL